MQMKSKQLRDFLQKNIIWTTTHFQKENTINMSNFSSEVSTKMTSITLGKVLLFLNSV